MSYLKSLGLALGLLVVWSGVSVSADKPVEKKAAKDNVATTKSTDANAKGNAKDKAKASTKARTLAKARAKAEQKFIRVVLNESKQPKSMQTSIVRYKPSDGTRAGVVVDLIGAVHIGDKKYYDELNKAMAKYDVLLYELVAPEGTRIPKGGREGGSGHPIAALQQTMKNMLKLEFQLEQIDYTKKHFLHADMSPAQFAKSMHDRGESWLLMFFRMMGQGMAQQGSGQMSDVDLLKALFSKDRDLQLKRIMAKQLGSMGGAMDALSGPTGSTIVTERNKVALKIMAEQIKAGKKRIGIFYGAAHMVDMEERLLADFKLKQHGEPKWIEAWNMQSKNSNDNSANKPVAKKPAVEKSKK